MVNQVSSSKDFFPEAKLNAQPTAENAAEASYEEVMKKVVEKKQAPLKQKADKPKVGNKEPFFPEKPMPYHPEEKAVTRRTAVKTAESGSVAEAEVESASEGKEQKKQEVVILPELEGVDYEKLVKAYESGDSAAAAELMNASYQSSQVSYPVSQIASKSLDEETKKMMMDQGVWNMQASYVAQPSPKLLTMMEVVNQNQMQNVPVSKPVAQFMDSMQSELGVQPDRLAQAMLKLPEGQFAKSPEDTMNQVIKNLNLNKQDEKVATALYSKMLNEMQQLDKPEAMPQLMPLPVEAKANQNLSLQKQNLNLDALNLQQENKMSIQSQMPQQQQQSQEFNMGQKSFETPELKPEIKADVTASDFRSDLSALTQSNHGKHNALPNINGGMMVGNMMGAAVNAEAKQEAIQNIINNAQALSQKGGGEMTLTLRPDHLGEIQLKVSMNGSNVDIQMIAEKSETKKLIEQNISDLKHGLAQHNLSMEKLDVSVGDKNTGNFNQGRQPDFNQAREFSQSFAGQQQARKNNERELDQQFRHRSMLKTVSTSDALRQRAGSSSGRLNVVA